MRISLINSDIIILETPSHSLYANSGRQN